MPAKTISIISKLDELEKTEGELPALLQFYKKLLNIQNGTEQQIKVQNPAFTVEAVKAHASKGKCLLSFNALSFDWQLMLQTFKEVVALFENYKELFGSLPQEVSKLAPRRIINKRTVRAWYNGKPLVLPVEIAPETEILLNNIFHATIKPFLSRQAVALTELIDIDIWRRGYCPVCGGSPDFAYLAKETGNRWLVCSRCDTEWIFQRLQCPYCDNTDQSNLSYFTNDEGQYRLYLCEKCRHYLKTIDLRAVKGEALLPLERFLTLDIDRQAQEKGYQPCL